MILYLSLKEIWYRLIEAGIKIEEYREITEYWTKRLVGKHYDFVEFTLGYPKSNDLSRRMRYRLDGIEVRTGNPDWGAEPGKIYYVLKIGERIII